MNGQAPARRGIMSATIVEMRDAVDGRRACLVRTKLDGRKYTAYIRPTSDGDWKPYAVGDEVDIQMAHGTRSAGIYITGYRGAAPTPADAGNRELHARSGKAVRFKAGNRTVKVSDSGVRLGDDDADQPAIMGQAHTDALDAVMGKLNSLLQFLQLEREFYALNYKAPVDAVVVAALGQVAGPIAVAGMTAATEASDQALADAVSAVGSFRSQLPDHLSPTVFVEGQGGNE